MTDMKELEKWAKYFKTIGHPLRLAIILMLQGSEILRASEHSLTFSEIKSITAVPSDENLSYHLRELEKSGFISKDAYKDEKGRVYPIYHATPLAKSFLKDLGLARMFENTFAKFRQ